MADFNLALKIILADEGGYSNDPQDSGGETYKGISRKNFPDWEGWKYIDTAKNDTRIDTNGRFPETLNFIDILKSLVADFYRENFWNKIAGDNIQNNEIADELVHSAENAGISQAIKRAQQICGQNPTGHITPDLINALNSLL